MLKNVLIYNTHILLPSFIAISVSILPLKLNVCLTHTQNRETPLHFACKYGREEIVAFLVSFSCTCQTIKNKYGQVPADVVCKDGNKHAKSRIEQLLKGTLYVRVCVLCLVV